MDKNKVAKELIAIAKLLTAVGWDKLPKGWTKESAKKYWKTMTGQVKHKVTKCIKKMEPHMGDGVGGFCASLADMIDGINWRKKTRKKKS